GKQTNEWELAIKQTEVKPKDRCIRTGLLFTAGLIAGEALTGVIVAFIIIAGFHITLFDIPPVLPGFLVWLFIALLVFYIPLRDVFNKES
ncbi:MAG: oligopeptide transporter, OPT family, partial [Candidatus Thermoplasmatota archaeon]